MFPDARRAASAAQAKMANTMYLCLFNIGDVIVMKYLEYSLIFIQFSYTS